MVDISLTHSWKLVQMMEDCIISIRQAWHCSLKNWAWNNHQSSWEKVVFRNLTAQNWLCWKPFQDAEPHFSVMSYWAAPLANTEQAEILLLLQCLYYVKMYAPDLYFNCKAEDCGDIRGIQKIIRILLLLIIVIIINKPTPGFSIFFFSLKLLISVKSLDRIS